MTSSVVVDAETLSEFLDKSEPFVSYEILKQWNLRLQEQRSWLNWLVEDVREEAVQTALLAPLRVTRKLEGLKREAALSAMAALIPAIREQNTERLISQFKLYQDDMPWITNWGTLFLHLTDPVRYPWWPRWMYDVPQKTGALALVVDNPQGLADDPAIVYAQLQHASNFVEAVLSSIRRLEGLDETFRPTVLFGMVYAVYMYTMSAWKLTDEFTQVFPPFPKVVETLLLIHR